MDDANAILSSLGLTPNETKVFLAMIGKNSYTASEIARVAGVPRGIIYRVLDDLVAKGLCILKPGKLKRYAASDPSIGMNQMIDTRKRILQDAVKLQYELKKKYLEGLGDDSPLEFIEIMRDPALINARVIELNDMAESELVSFMKGPYLAARLNTVSEQLQSTIRMKKRGVAIRGLYEVRSFVDPLTGAGKRDDSAYLETVQLLRSIFFSAKHCGEEARITVSLPIKAMIWDEKYIIILLPDPVPGKVSSTCVMIRHPDLAISLKMLFNFIWELADDWRDFMKQHNVDPRLEFDSNDIELRDLKGKMR